MPAVLAVFVAAGVYVVMYQLNGVSDVALYKPPVADGATASSPTADVEPGDD